MMPRYTLSLYNAIQNWDGNEESIIQFAKGMCKGLAHMHKNELAHRDIKLDNIMINKDGFSPVIIDFGLVNSTGIRDGTVSYLSPEQ